MNRTGFNHPLTRLPTLIAVCLVYLSLSPLQSQAHIGSPNVVFEGEAGPYPVRVIIRPPGVVPGLAEISVRLQSETPHEVTVLPVFWKTGTEGSPPPDKALPIPGNPGLYSAELWLMKVGSYSVHVTVNGPDGEGSVIVPIASVATTPQEMPQPLGITLVCLGILLFTGAVSIVGAAIRESHLAPSTTPSRKRIWGARASMAACSVGLAAAVGGGWLWWMAVDKSYRSNQLYKSTETTATIRNVGPQQILQLKLAKERWNRSGRGLLVPDHGKMMHLFMVSNPDLNTFAHLHPQQLDRSTFEVVLPPLPDGNYQIYADVTDESGMAHTLTTTTQLGSDATTTPPPQENERKPDPDDSWYSSTTPSVNQYEFNHPNGQSVIWENPKASDESLRFQVRGKDGQPAELQPYMGMLSHAIIRKKDGSVFAHLHPSGTISVAAQQVFQLRAQGKPPDIITAEALEPFCKDPSLSERREALQFPYEFPATGDYRIWIQTKINGTVQTAMFDHRVE